jgi:thiosulfate/3-mercaptopyruvate sulfurtransferase
MSDYAHPDVIVDTQWVTEHLRTPNVRIVEVGDDLSDHNSEHIPGVVNIPWYKTLKEDRTFKSVEELQALYTNKGVIPDKGVIPYCIVGGPSNHTWIVLTYLLSNPKVRVYD